MLSHPDNTSQASEENVQETYDGVFQLNKPKTIATKLSILDINEEVGYAITVRWYCNEHAISEPLFYHFIILNNIIT